MEDLVVMAGTYQRSGEQGIFNLRLDRGTGVLRLQGAWSGVDAPSFLALHPSGRWLYAVSEHAHGAVWSFDVNEENGLLEPKGSQPSHGAAPCHLTLDPEGRHVFTVNYASGTVLVYPIRADGAVDPASTIIEHRGSSVHERQRSAHPHSMLLERTGRFAYCADLGTDEIITYRWDSASGALIRGEGPHVRAKPGAGPRHMDEHPQRDLVFALNELDSTLVLYRKDSKTGSLSVLQTLSTLPEGFRGPTYAADVHVHPSGRFVYTTNRGHDSIAGFRLEEGTDRLTPLDHTSTGGRTPRHFLIDPLGAFLLVGNQDSDSVEVFAHNPDTGALQSTGQRMRVPKVACLKVVPTPHRRRVQESTTVH